MQNTKLMSFKSGLQPCMACKAKVPHEDKHTLCAWCLGVQHATLALEREVACSICAAFQPWVRENRLERATRASSTSSVASPSAAVSAPEPLLHELSQDPLLDISDAQAHRSRSPSPQARRVKHSKQVRDIMDLKAQMAQILELLSKQAPATPAAVPAPIQPQLPYPPSPTGDQGEWEEVSQLAQENTLSIVASRDDMQVGGEPEPPAEEEPSFEVASEASTPPLSNPVSAWMGRAAAFLQVPWMPAAEPGLHGGEEVARMMMETDSDSESDSGSDFYPTDTPSDVTEEVDSPSSMEELVRNPEKEVARMMMETDSDSESDSGSDFYPTDTPSDVTEEVDSPSSMEELVRNPENDLMEHMVVMTNRYAAQFLQQQRDSLGPHAHAHKWKETSVPELKKPEKNGPKKDAGCAQRKAYAKTAAAVA
ncbi:UNVERIFIED_CONTAM: hypothetical protein FKN15_056957 [Acipenser sinensis]